MIKNVAQADQVKVGILFLQVVCLVYFGVIEEPDQVLSFKVAGN